MRLQIKTTAAASAMLLLLGCGSVGSMLGSDNARSASPTAAPAPAAAGVPDTPVRVGDPYSVGGQRYVPVDQVDYDEVGYASWYGAELAGRPTANGETFDPAWVSAAHRTLPMPSYVEVTRLDTGQTILVRINDRGPGDSRRLIDLSAGAAAQLGITEMGSVPVRVRRTNPVDAERIALRSGRAVPERLLTPDSLLAILRERAARLPNPGGRSAAATPAPRPAPAARPPVARPPRAPSVPTVERDAVDQPAAQADAGTGFVVQLGAFSSRPRADALAQRLSATVVTAGTVHRVRLGPFATEAEANAALAQARRRGHPGGVVVRNR
jgi:rare lipoprotein A